MKKKLGKFILMLVLITGILFSMTACGGTTATGTTTGTETKTTYKITLVIPESEAATVYQGLTSVSFVQKDSKTGKYTIVKPSVTPKKVGQEFVRWCSDEKCTKELEYGAEPTSDLSIYPQWKAAQVQITVMNELESEPSIVYVDYGKTLADYPDTFDSLTMNGYTFTGWFTDYARTVACDLEAAVTENMTVYAGWKAVTYQINYKTNGGALPKDAPTEYGLFSDITLPTCTKEGYIFCGWYENSSFSGEAVTEIIEGTRGIKNFYAKFLCNIADVKYVDASETVSGNTLGVDIPAVATVVDLSDYLVFPENSTYTVLNGQQEVSLSFSANDGETKNTTYTLQVTSESGKVTKTYMLVVTQFSSAYISLEFYNGSEKYYYDYSSYQVGEKVNKPASDPTPAAGYTFAYWEDAEGNEFDFTKTVKTDTLTLYAKYDAIEYTVTYALGRGKNAATNPTVYTIESELTFANAIPDFDDYTFDGWYDGNDKVSGIEAGSQGNITLKAKYALKNRSLTDFEDETEITKEEFPDFLAYVTYNRLTDITITVTGATSLAEMEEYIAAADNGLNVDGKYMSFAYNYNSENFNLTSLTLTYCETTDEVWSETEANPQVNSEDRLSATGRSGYSDFAIDYIVDTLSVSDSEQLVYALEHGYRPVPTQGSEAESLYAQAKTVLNTILDTGMTDYDKVLAIYEYIIKSVSYDDELFDAVMNEELVAQADLEAIEGWASKNAEEKAYEKSLANNKKASEYASFYLQGAMVNKIAVCDGISKEFMVLCRIEGIPAVQVEGSSCTNGSGHAWNKVYLAVGEEEPAWYLIDCTSGNLMVGTDEDCVEYLSHKYFLITDTDMYNEGNGYEANVSEEFNYAANTAYNFYENTEYTVDDDDYTFVVSSNAELAIFFKYIVSNIPSVGTQWACADVEFASTYNPDNTDFGLAYGLSGIDSSLYNLSLTNLDAKHIIFTFSKQEE